MKEGNDYGFDLNRVQTIDVYLKKALRELGAKKTEMVMISDDDYFFF